jgi:cobalt-zinc-cadmium efflux system membrane fusion protein
MRPLLQGSAKAHVAPETRPSSNATPAEATVELEPSQLNAIRIEPVGTHRFSIEKEAVGTIDFDGDLAVQVFPTVQGKLLKAFAELGDEVIKGQPLYTIDSSDLVQAESSLISATAAFELSSKQLVRVKALGETNGIAQKEVEQTISEHQTAEGALKAARDAVRIFGKSDSEIDQIFASRKVDAALVVPSPIAGQITSKNNTAPGLLVQPGTAPAPYTVADISVKWMLASVPESESPLFHVGQPVQARVLAYPDRVFEGKISKTYAAVDPATHRVTIRSDIRDEKDELRPGMLASFVIRVQEPLVATAIPANGVVRESDGTMTAWVTTDRRRFVQRVVKTGLRKEGQVQILEGLRPGELAVTEGAVFLSNLFNALPTD